jgi:hypothetical protein
MLAFAKATRCEAAASFLDLLLLLLLLLLAAPGCMGGWCAGMGPS